MTRFQSYKRFAKPPPQAMPRPKVWGDFTEDASFEGEDDAGDDLVEFTCPYNCGKPIRMKARNVIKNKCTECRLHLIKCNGVRADGQKAEDDPRITRPFGDV